MENELDKIVWQEPWRPLVNAQAGEDLCKELAREVNSRHILYEKKVTAIGITGEDDVLFLVHDQPVKLAVVHLTWARSPDLYHEWPFASILETVDSFVRRMASDHEFQLGLDLG